MATDAEIAIHQEQSRRRWLPAVGGSGGQSGLPWTWNSAGCDRYKVGDDRITPSQPFFYDFFFLLSFFLFLVELSLAFVLSFADRDRSSLTEPIRIFLQGGFYPQSYDTSFTPRRFILSFTMVFIKPFIGAAALLSGLVHALPTPGGDSSSGKEVAVSAPDGILLTDTAELARQSASEAAAMADTAAPAYATAESQAWPAAASVDTASAYVAPSASAYVAPSAAPYVAASSAYVAPPAYTAAPAAASTAAYGSGSVAGNGYENCVQQCIASFGQPAATYQAPSATESVAAGTGATHTVIVAPSQGVLRFVPFAVNASVGDTIKFMWGANNHTVTKSSQLTPCNRSEDALFASGTQNKDFVFTQVVNTTDPTFYYCATVGHCSKGMFGIINPPNALDQTTSVASMMQAAVANDATGTISAEASWTASQTNGSVAASNWGNSIDMASIPDWAQQPLLENVMYTRAVLGQNPELIKDDGSIDFASVDATPLMVPQDISVALSSNTGSSASASGASPSATGASNGAAASASGADAAAATPSNGAGAMSSPKLLVALFAAVATFFAL